jgi:multiple sugar transport system substrate-binding protein
MAGGTAPDMMEFETKRMPSFAALKSLYDLTPYAARSQDVTQDAFYPVDWDRAHWSGKLFLFPYESKPAVIFYNKALFDKKQVPYPKYSWADPKWTWDEFLSVAQKLTEGSGAQRTFGYYHPTWWVYAQPYIWSNGGTILDADRTKSTLDAPEDQAALQFLQDLIYKHKVAAGPTEVAEGLDTMFGTGRVGMWFTNCGLAPTLAKNQSLQWDVAPPPLPPGKSKLITRAPADGYAIAAQTKQVDAVWKAAVFFGSPENAKRASGVPSRKAVGDAGTYALAQQPGIAWKNYSDGLANSHDEPVTTVFQEMDTKIWTPGFDPYWANKETPAQLAASLAGPTADLLKKAIR